MRPNKDALLIAKISDLVATLPADLVPEVAHAMHSCGWPDWSYCRLRLMQVTPHPGFRDAIAKVLDAWEHAAPDTSPMALSLALSAAVETMRRVREEQSLELVCTGPDAGGPPLRRTDQALLQVIESAQSSLLIVSFAVYKVEAITEALVCAAARDVRLSICLESSERDGGHVAYDTLAALGTDVARIAAVYVWPHEARAHNASGRTGSLHAKCAVADNRMLLISSANLTEHAMNLNIEMGVLIEGGRTPSSVADYFRELIAQGVLVRVDTG